MTTKDRFKFGFTPELSGFKNMEIDRYFGESDPPEVPMVRFFTWKSPAISLGRNQDASRRLNLDRCREDDLEVVIRPTGGRELLHGHDLSYSVIWPGRFGVLEANRLFGEINGILLNGLIEMGINASLSGISTDRRPSKGPCFVQADRGEIIAGGRKLMASAQRVFPEAVLQQGSMPLRAPRVDLAGYLARGDRSEMRKRLENSTRNLYSLIDETFSTEEIVEIFKKAFERRFGAIADAAGSELGKEIIQNR